MDKLDKHNERIAQMTFASVYPHYVVKVEKKDRTKAELHQVIEWLTGYDEKKLQELIEAKVTFQTFFEKANLNPIWYSLQTSAYLLLSTKQSVFNAIHLLRDFR